LYRSIARHFESDEPSAQDPVQRRQHILMTVQLGLAVGLPFSIYNLNREGMFAVGLAELAALLLLVVPAAVLGARSVALWLAEILILAAGVVIFGALIVARGVEGTSLFWGFMFPFLAFFLKGQRLGWIYSMGFLFAAASYMLVLDTLLPAVPQYSTRFAIHYAVTLWAFTVIASGFSLMRIRFEEKLQARVKARTLELEQHRKQLEHIVAERTRELVVAKEAAEAANAAKDTFLATISHELRTPLNGVIGMAGLARGMATEPKQRDYLDKIAHSGKHLNRVINDLLDLSKIAAGHMELEVLAFSPRALIQHCTSLMAPRAAEKGLYLRETVAPAVPEVLRGDPHRLEQILLNLLGNAIKFTQTGGVEIEIAPATSGKGRFGLRIEVSDSGPGMSADALAKLFTPFSQADATVSRRHGGTGLGLAISRRLAEMMGGDIAVASQPGQGTSFTVRICCEVGDVAELPDSAPPGHESPTSYRDVHVLVVEDQDINREIIEALLAESGIDVQMAVNGREAVDILQRSGPDAFDLVLMDIQMPVMDGLSATREIRRRPGFEKLPIVALTAHTMEHEKAISREAGVSDHISKPFDNQSFHTALARWIPAHKQIAAASPVTSDVPAPGMVELGAVPGLDIADALARFGNREDRLLHWLRDFLANGKSVPAQIRHEIAAGQWTTAAQTAHAFKGRVGTLGMEAILPLASRLEDALCERAPAADILAELEQVLDGLHSELSRHLGESPTANPVAAPIATPIAWSDSYSVDVPELDDQHRRLVELINRIGDDYGPRNAFTDGLFHEVLRDMFDYTRVHFAAEEDYLRQIAYPQLAAHQREHAAFTTRVMEFIDATRHGRQDRQAIHGFLLDWLTSHILESDMQYRAFLDDAAQAQPQTA
jgi:hemerythrin-like metal-binding protein